MEAQKKRGEHDHPAWTAKWSQAAAQNRRTALPRNTEGAHESATTLPCQVGGPAPCNSHTRKASNSCRHQPKTAQGVGGRCVGTRLDANQWREVGGLPCGRGAVGGRWALCRQPCVLGASWGFLRPFGGAPSLRFGRGRTPRQRRFAPALAPLGGAPLTPKKSYHPSEVVGLSQKTHLSGLSRRTSEVLAMHWRALQ